MKNLIPFFLMLLVATVGWAQGVQLQGNGDIHLNASSPEVQFRTANGTTTNGTVKFLSNGLFLENKMPTSIWFQTNDLDRMRIHQDGNIGIGTGTATPQTKLEVRGDLTIQEGNPGIFFRNNAGDLIGEVRSTGSVLEIESENDAIRLQTNSITRMLIDGAGNIGIGTINLANGYKLSVDGRAIAEEVWVELSGTWPDFVFAEDYQLPTLPQLATQIKTLGHLPNMPSAAEVAEQGFSLGDMNRNLLQKVEELTLYAIEADSKNRQLTEELRATQKSVAALEEKMEKLLSQH